MNDDRKIDQPRLEWVDIAKGYGIILVVLGHLCFSDGFIAQFIWSFHMPYFFMISGLLFNSDKYSGFINFASKRSANLLLPYFIFTIIVYFWYSLLNNPMASLSVIYRGWFNCYPLWFIPVLFFTEILYCCICKIDKAKLFVILFASSIIGYIFHLKDIHLYYKLEVVFTAIFFYGFGNLLKSYIISLLHKLYGLKTHLILGLIISLCIMCYFAGNMNAIRLDLSGNRIGYYIPAYITSIIGISMMFVISNLTTKYNSSIFLATRTAISFIGKNSYVILAFHMIVYSSLKILFLNLNISYYVSGILRQVLLWYVLFVMIYFINNYCPWIMGKKIKIRLYDRNK